MKELKNIIEDLNQDIVCGKGTEIFIQNLKDIKPDPIYKQGGIKTIYKYNGVKYKLGTLGTTTILVDLNLLINDMKLYDVGGNVLVDLVDYGYYPLPYRSSWIL